MIPIVKSVSAPTSQVLKLLSGFSFTGRFRFLLLICHSPPYKYIISYGAPYVNSFYAVIHKIFLSKKTPDCCQMPLIQQLGYKTNCREMEELMPSTINSSLYYSKFKPDISDKTDKLYFFTKNLSNSFLTLSSVASRPIFFATCCQFIPLKILYRIILCIL